MHRKYKRAGRAEEEAAMPGPDDLLTIDRTQTHLIFDARNRPAAEADSGDTVRFLCVDCYDGQIDEDGTDFSRLDMTRNNPVTGPLYVRGAEPGDVLKLEILSVEPGGYGVMCVRPGKGIYEVEGAHCRCFPIRDGAILFDRGVKIPARQMSGVIGTCPAQPEKTQYPGEHGGNLDMRELGAGSTLYLPVFVPGALLSVGDLHAVQGDGETAICGLEMSGTVTLRVTVQKDARRIPTPFLVTEDAYYTLAADESLDDCSVRAARKMHGWLTQNFDLTDAQAAMLLSLQGNLRITQVVNPRRGCAMELSRKITEQLKERSR